MVRGVRGAFIPIPSKQILDSTNSFLWVGFLVVVCCSGCCRSRGILRIKVARPSCFALFDCIPLTRRRTKGIDLRQAAWCHSHRTWGQFLAS
jgi:hypothetical protein